MIVENPDAFKAWMTTVLEPLCDADPEALAKYVYALVKKDKPTDELRKGMVAQLEVFLQKDTKDFVDLLFSKLETGFKNETAFLVRIKEEPMDRMEPAPPPPIPLQPQPQPPPHPPNDEDESDFSTGTLNEFTPNIEDVRLIPPPPPAVSSSELELEPDKMLPITQDLKPILAVYPAHDQQVQIRLDSPRLRNGSFGSVSAVIKQGERRLSSTRSYDRKSDSEREDKIGILRRRGSTGSPERLLRRMERSRSPSWEHRITSRRSRSKSRRSRSRGRERERSRPWRNKSPPFRNRGYERDRKMRSWSKSPPLRSRSRSPLPLQLRSRYRHRSPLVRSRSRSHSPYDSPRRSSPLSRATTPTQDSNHGDDLRLQNMQSVVNFKNSHAKKRRCRDFDEKGYCMRGEMCPYDHGKDPVVLEDMGQVLSFSAPGAPALPPPPGLEPPTPSMSLPLMQPAIAPGMTLHHRPQLMNRPPPNLSEYNPNAPSMEPRMWAKQPFRTSGRGMTRGGGMMRGPPVFGPHHQRELINVPVMEGEDGSFYPHPMQNSMKRQCPPEFSNDMETMLPLKQRFDYARLGLRRGNCSLQLKKVPSGLNNIAHLHNHFVKFGKIVNIQVSFEGDPEAALITFTCHAEASAAYKSTEAVLNNRFIKVFWYSPDKDVYKNKSFGNIENGLLQNKQENVLPLNRTSAKERLGAPVMNVTPASSNQEKSSELEKVFLSGSKITKTVFIPSVSEFKPPVKPDKKKLFVTTNFINTMEVQTVSRESLRLKQDDKEKEMRKLSQSLLNRKYELMNKYIAHQDFVVDKLEDPNTPADKKPELLQALKSIQNEVGKVTEEINTDLKAMAKAQSSHTVKVTPQLVKRTREEVGGLPPSNSAHNVHTQKQILDAELDLFNHQQEGKDTTELQKRVLELRTKAHNLGLLAANNGVLRVSRGGSRYRSGRGIGGGFNPHSTVDHRPTKLLVSGFESDDKADVLEHFSKFGEVVGHVWDEATPALVIQFKTRKDAETAMAKGRNFQDRLMSVTWFTPAQSMGMRSAGLRSVILLNENVGDLLSEHEEEDEALRINLDANEDFLLQDEEEEEDEERSWRR